MRHEMGREVNEKHRGEKKEISVPDWGPVGDAGCRRPGKETEQ